MKKLALAFALIAASAPVMAVDGYKDLKFGMSVDDVLQNQPCTLSEAVSPISTVTYYYCEDLPFGGDLVPGNAFFIDGKLLRFSIDLSTDAGLGALKGLLDKYGRPSQTSTQDDFNRVGTAPGAKAVTGFDSNTVLIVFDTLPTLETGAYVVYTDPRYDQILTDAQAKGMASDL